MSGFGENLKAMMQGRNTTAVDLAKAINVPLKSVREWLQHDRFPRDPDIIKRLSGFFGCSVHKVMYGTEDPFNLIGNVLEKTEIHTGMYEITVKKVNPK